MKTVFVLIGSLALTGGLCANPAKDAKRAISGQTVDLTPLVEWWKHRSGDRPLAGWVQVTGRVVGTNAYGWTVEGKVDDPLTDGDKESRTASHSKFILKSPPVQELTMFNQLDTRLSQLKTQRDELNREIKSDDRREEKLSEKHKGSTKRARARAHKANLRMKQTQADEKNTRDRLEAVEKEIKEVEKLRKDISEGNRYTVDCFALRLNLQLSGLPIYDHGAVLK